MEFLCLHRDRLGSWALCDELIEEHWSYIDRAFAFDEPNYQAGVYRDVLLRRWRKPAGTRHVGVPWGSYQR